MTASHATSFSADAATAGKLASSPILSEDIRDGRRVVAAAAAEVGEGTAEDAAEEDVAGEPRGGMVSIERGRKFWGAV